MPQNIQVGQAVTFQASGADPAGDQDPLEFEWELGRRGEVITQGAVSQFDYVFHRGGQYWISVTLKDDDGVVTTGFQINVTANLNPRFRKLLPNASDAS
ncbi:MAG: PKD domain-containing protein [Pirellulaceae bacterium]